MKRNIHQVSDVGERNHKIAKTTARGIGLLIEHGSMVLQSRFLEERSKKGFIAFAGAHIFDREKLVEIFIVHSSTNYSVFSPFFQNIETTPQQGWIILESTSRETPKLTEMKFDRLISNFRNKLLSEEQVLTVMRFYFPLIVVVENASDEIRYDTCNNEFLFHIDCSWNEDDIFKFLSQKGHQLLLDSYQYPYVLDKSSTRYWLRDMETSLIGVLSNRKKQCVFVALYSWDREIEFKWLSKEQCPESKWMEVVTTQFGCMPKWIPYKELNRKMEEDDYDEGELNYIFQTPSLVTSKEFVLAICSFEEYPTDFPETFDFCPSPILKDLIKNFYCQENEQKFHDALPEIFSHVTQYNYEKEQLLRKK